MPQKTVANSGRVQTRASLEYCGKELDLFYNRLENKLELCSSSNEDSQEGGLVPVGSSRIMGSSQGSGHQKDGLGVFLGREGVC